MAINDFFRTLEETRRQGSGGMSMGIGGLPTLSGGSNPIPYQVGNAMTGLGMSGNKGISFGSNPNLTPPTPTRGFGTRIADVFKDERRFADAITGLALLSGTPSNTAMGIRDALAPVSSSTSKSVGAVYNVRNRTTGELTGEQVYSTDEKKMREIAANPNLELVTPTEAVETGKTPEGYRKVVDAQGNVSYEYIKGYDEPGVQEEIRKTMNHITVTQEQTRRMEDAYLNVIAYAKKQDNGVVRQGVLSSGLIEPDSASLTTQVIDAIRTGLTSDEGRTAKTSYGFIKGNNFVNAIQNMRNSNKTGGGVGSVTENEMKVLSATAADLSPSSSQFLSQLQFNLQRVGEARTKILKEANIDLNILKGRLSSTTAKAMFPEEEASNGV